MRVFMLGWEFPPHISGGLGTACHGLTKGLDEVGVEVCFVLPTAVPDSAESHVKFRSPSNLPAATVAAATPPPAAPGSIEEQVVASEEFEHVEMHQVNAVLQPYGRPQTQESILREMRSRQVETTVHTEIPATDPPAATPDETPAEAPAEEPADPPAEEIPSGTFSSGGGVSYEGDLFGQINRYARLAVEISRRETFDVVHAHDWMTFPAGMAVAAASGKPLVVHVHSTEFDRSGTNVDQRIYDIERMGMHSAARVVCVSLLTRNVVTHHYGIPAARTDVVYNAVELPEASVVTEPIGRNEKIVLFLGRVTMQKGPEYFLRAAKKVVDKFKKVRFIMAGSGDMITRCVEEAAALGIGRYVTFTGFLRGDDVDKVFAMADLYVMPSVSEPFGIAPLEALSHNVPVIISKQSGVSEVLTHALKVDFWDTDEMANKILAVLRHQPLQKTLRQHGQIELRKLSWRDSAEKLKTIYGAMISSK
jgi:glycogen synthase